MRFAYPPYIYIWCMLAAVFSSMVNFFMPKLCIPNTTKIIVIVYALSDFQGSTREAVEIRLEPLDIPRFRAAQIQLCRALNEKEIRLRNGKRLLYDVGSAPKNVQKNSPIESNGGGNLGKLNGGQDQGRYRA